MQLATSDYDYKTFLNSHEKAESESKMENFKTSTYGTMVEIERCIDVATLRMLMSWTRLRHIIRYANRARDGGVVRHPPSVQIHQSIRLNLKTNFTKTSWCCKTAGGLLPLTRRSHDSEILSYGLPS